MAVERMPLVLRACIHALGTFGVLGVCGFRFRLVGIEFMFRFIVRSKGRV